MEEDHPYRAEYAKSGRAKCKSCKGDISKDSLRLAAMVQVNNSYTHFHFIYNSL